MQDTVCFLGSRIEFMPNNVSARSLHATRTVVLLIWKVDSDIILILGWWRFDDMFCYLHLLAERIMSPSWADARPTHYALLLIETQGEQ